MLRSVGALIFGTIADRYGRKWPMIVNLCFFIILELATGFTKNLSQFLAVRSLYGIAMGGLFGPAAATALEDLPYDARGILSGLFEQGYATGYLLAAIFFRALVPTTSHGWRSLFWFGAGPPVLIILFRWYLPETNGFQVHQAERLAKHQMSLEESDGTDAPKISPLRAFAREFRSAFARNVRSTFHPKQLATDCQFIVVFNNLYGRLNVGIQRHLSWKPRLLPHLPTISTRNGPHTNYSHHCRRPDWCTHWCYVHWLREHICGSSTHNDDRCHLRRGNTASIRSA